MYTFDRYRKEVTGNSGGREGGEGSGGGQGGEGSSRSVGGRPEALLMKSVSTTAVMNNRRRRQRPWNYKLGSEPSRGWVQVCVDSMSTPIVWHLALWSTVIWVMGQRCD